MKKVIILTAVMFAVLSGILAQDSKPLSLGLGVNLNLPTGDFGEISSFGAGVRLQAEIPIAPMITGIGSVSYNRFFYKDKYEDIVDESGLNAIPIQIGARVYPIDRFFIGAQFGYGIISGAGESDGGFSYNPHVGLNFPKAQVLLGYDAISKDGTLGWLGLSAILKL